MPTLAEMLAAKRAAGKPQPSGGLVIRPPEGRLPASAISPQPELDLRELGQPEPGETIPMVHPEEPSEVAWEMVRHAWQTELCVWIDPEKNQAWLAVERQDLTAGLILLHPLRITTRCRPSDPF